MPRRWQPLALLALLLLTAGGRVDAQQAPSLALDPPSQTIVLEDGPFEIRATVDDVTTPEGLGGYTLVVTYDPTVVRALTITDSGFVASTDSVVLCPSSAIDNDAGRLAHFCFTVPILAQPGPQTSESQVLARVTFEPVGVGTTVLDMSETKIIDPEGTALEATTANGVVTVQSSSPAQPTQPVPEQDGGTDGGQSVGLYIGVGIAGLTIVALVGAALEFWRRRRRAAGR